MVWSSLIAVLVFSATALGHAQTEEKRKAHSAALHRIATHSKRSLAACAETPAAIALRQRAVARRAAWANELRRSRGLTTQHVRRGKQELEKWMAISHNQTEKGYTLDTPLNELFTSNASCIFVPETIIGPYYVAGEYLRKDISENEPGVPIYVDFQFVDVKTCEAVPHLIVDVWHANALGVYSGVTAAGQGGLKTNFGRGVQITDDEGVVQYRSIFPGHYIDRTSHLHVMSTNNATVLGNGTFEGGTVLHIGQTYFDQSLISVVEANPPYSSNKQPFTDNRHDKLTGDEATELSDPFMKYVYLGDDVKDGLLLWMTVGLDKNANHNANVSAAAHWHPGGGTDESGAKASVSSPAN
ncbi:hypothetical protein E4U57_004013 [Claviceps arundinis]|uniref:Intradiol ring-cleavage dioxygenases domain-containing protein n=1 Tax=Claviceps arundinis TaxID=1623583 RepID=A0A9P7MZ39_9HYPO|nr:hypothetical protein E4U57_004013 [Claviceps arundinis]KAG5976456.1 hypothetical protein E4U56_001980 [Claviceps arundinis]